MNKLLYAGVITVGLLASGCGGDQNASRVAADDYGTPTVSPGMTPPMTSPGMTAPGMPPSPMTSPYPSPTMTPTQWNVVTKARVAVGDTRIGKILVGENGRTLYLFEADKDGKSTCSGPCAVAWPPYITTEEPEAGAGAKPELLGTVRRDDGSLQVTYNKHPLYYYIRDRQAGDTLGEDIEQFGAEWYALTPDGRKAR